MQYLSITETTLQNLQTFESVEKLNDSIKLHKQTHELSETDRNILDAISRYSCKFAGVCYLSKQRIAEDAGYKSRRTAIRACNRMEALGVIEQHETKRVKGDRRQATNIIVIKAVSKASNTIDKDPVINKCHSQVTAESHAKETPLKASNSSNTLLDTEKPTADTVMRRGLKHTIPSEIYEAMQPFFSGKEMYDNYGILLRAKASIDRNIMLEEYGSQYADTFFNVIRLYKSGKVRKSLEGLLYASWERLSAEISRQQAAVAMGMM